MRASHILRLFLVAVGIPAAIQIADEWALRFAAQRDWSVPAMGMIYALFVAQVGLLGFVVGRFVDRWVLRWVVLVWGLTLVDAMLFRLVWEQPGWYHWRGWGNSLPYALLSGQFGLVVIWGAFGPVPWPSRLPGFLVAAILVASFGFALAGRNDAWVALAVIQGGATVGLCVPLWLLGFRLRSGERLGSSGDELSGKPVFQFSLRHMLLWMAALVPILLLGQALDLWFVLNVPLWDWLGLASIALGLGFASLIAIWAALGSGWTAIRVGSLAMMPAVVGGVLKVTIRPRAFLWRDISREFDKIGWGWVAWTFLAAWFLAGLLLMFRASGYRLVRTPCRRGTGPAADDVSSDSTPRARDCRFVQHDA
jgi:hypothetical protein